MIGVDPLSLTCPSHLCRRIPLTPLSLWMKSVGFHDVADETGTGYGIEIAQLQKASDMLAHAFKLAYK